MTPATEPGISVAVELDTRAVAAFVVFRLAGRDYDAAVISAGFAGIGIGATPVGVANMHAVTQRFGPSAKAFLVIPLLGAFFLDLANAATIQAWLGLLRSSLPG